MQNAQRSLSVTGKKLQKVGAGLTAGVTLPLVGIGVAALDAVLELEGVAQGFERLNNANLLKDLREATKGTVSDLDLMKNAVQANNFQIPLKELGTLMDFARRRAKETGENVDFLVNSIVTGIGRKSPLILDNLGISAAALKDELGGASAAASSISEVTEAVGSIARRELQAMGADATTLKEIYLQFKSNVANSLGEIGTILAEALKPAIEIARDLSKRFQELSPETKKFLVILGGVAAAVGPLLALAGTILPAIGTGLALLSGPIGLIVSGLTAIGVVIYRNWEPIEQTLRDIANYFVDLYNESTVFRVSVEAITTTFKNLLATGKFVFGVLGNAIAAIGQNIKNSFGSLGEIVKAVLTGDIASLPAILANGFKDGLAVGKDLVGDIKKDFASLKDTIQENVKEGIDNVMGREKYTLDPDNVDTEGLEKKVSDAVANGMAGGQSRAAEGVLNLDSAGITAVGNTDITAPILDSLNINDITEKQAEWLVALSEFNDQATGILQNGLVQGFTDAFSSIGESLINGGDIVGAIGATILKTIGQVAVQLGQAAIGIGVAMNAIKLSFSNPFTAIAAGAALIALGGALGAIANSAFGSSGGSSGGGSGSFGGVSGGGGSVTTFAGASARNGEIIGRIVGRDIVLTYNNNVSASRRLGNDLGIKNG